MQSENKILTLANIITVSRLVLLPFIVYFLLKDQRIIAFIIMLIALCTDAIDGYLARRMHQESETGKFLDPLCDKISLMVILITLLIINSIPLWGVIIIVLRDILILAGSFVLFKNRSVIFKSNFLGKITGLLLGAVVLVFMLNMKQLGNILLYLCIPAIIGSFVIYLGRYIRTMKGEG